MDPVSPPSSSSSSDAEDDAQDTSPSSNLPPDFKDQTEDMSSSGSEPEDDADAGPVSMFNVLKKGHVPSRYKAGNPNSSAYNANANSTATDDGNTVIAEEYNEELEGCIDIGSFPGESYVEVATVDSKLSECEIETDIRDNLKHEHEMEDESLADPDDIQEQPEQMATLTETDNTEASDTECPPPLPQSLPPPVAPKPIRINQTDTVTKVEDDIKQSDMQKPDEFDEGDTMTSADVDDQNDANLHDQGTTEDSLTMNETVQIRPPPVSPKPKLADRSSSAEHQNINPRTSTENQESINEQDTKTSASSTQLETNNQDQLEHSEDASPQDGNIEHENESQDGEEKVPCDEGNAQADQEIISESMMADMDIKKSMYKTLSNMESFVIVDKEFESGEDTQIVEEPKYNEVDKNEIVSEMANSETTKRIEEDNINEDNDAIDNEDDAVDDKNDVCDEDEQYGVKLKRTLSEEHEQFSTPQEGLSEDDDENEAEDAKFVDSIDTTEVEDNTQLPDNFSTNETDANNQAHNKSTDQAEKSQYLDLGESIVVIGKGTVRGGFISMSSSITESEIAKDDELLEPDIDAEETVELREKVTSQVSVKDRRSIFESFQNQQTEKNIGEPRKSKSSFSSGSSFELVSSVESHRDNIETNPIKQDSVEEAVDIKPCEPIEEMIKDKVETVESNNDDNMDKNDIPPAVGPRSLLVQEKRVSMLVEQKRAPPIRPRSQIFESLDMPKPDERSRSCERPTPRGRTISEDPTNTQSFAEGYMRPDDDLNKTFPLSSEQMASFSTPESSMPYTHQNQAGRLVGEPAGQFPDRKVLMSTHEQAGMPGHQPSTLPDRKVPMTTKEQTGMPGLPPSTQSNVPTHSMMPHWYWQQQAWQSYYQSNMGQQAGPGYPRPPMNNPQGPGFYPAPPGYRPSMQTPVDQTRYPATSMPEQSTPRQPVPKQQQPSSSKPKSNLRSMPNEKDKNESKDKEQIPLKRKDTPKPKHRSSKTPKEQSTAPKVVVKKQGVKKSISIEPKATPRKVNLKRHKTEGEADRKQEQPKEKPAEQQEFNLYVDGINHTTTKENLENYIESKIGGVEVVVGKTMINLPNTAAMIVLDGKPDMVMLKEKIQQRSIDDKNPRVYECTPPTSITISSEGKIADSVIYYFELPKNGGGELLKDQLEKMEDSGCYKLTFKNAEVVQTLCDGRQHKMDEQILRVSPCYECEAGSIWDTDLHAIPLPDTFKLDLKPGYSSILQRNCCSVLITKMEACFCKMKFEDQSVSLECTMTQSTPDVWKLVKTWQQDVQQAFDGYRNGNLSDGNVKIEKELWEIIVPFVLSSEFADDMVIVLPKKQDHTIQLVGFESNVGNKKTEIEEKRKALRRTSKSKPLKSRHGSKQGLFKVKLMETHGLFNELKRDQPDIEISYHNADITITGQPEDIDSAFVKIYEKADKIRDKKFPHGYHSDLYGFIAKPKVIKDITDVVNNKNAEWDIIESDIVVYVYNDSEDEDLANDVYRAIKGCIDEKSVQFNKEDCKLFADSSSKWQELSQDITERFEDKAEALVKDQDNAVIIYGFKNDVKSVKKIIEDFLEKNSIREEEVSCKPSAAEFIKKHSMKAITDIQGKNPEHQVEITVNNNSVTVRGTQEGLDVALREVKALVNRMMSDKHVIERIAVWHVLHDEKENGALDTIEKNTECLIKYPDEFETGYESSRSVHSHNATRQSQGASAYPDSDNDENELETSMASSFKCFKTKNGINVSLVEGEIGKQSGDILVVSTAPSLVLKSGASSKSVLSEGGDELQQKCHQMFPNEIKHGQIAAIPACGQLECQFVYFTSLPNYSEDGSKQILEKFVKDCLATASKHGKKSILFSAMGTGQLKYPRETVAMMMYETVIEFDSKNPKTSLKDVRFVLYQKDTETIKVFKDEERLHIEGKGSRPNYDVKVGSVNIQLLVENIAEQKVDGILCTTSPNMDLKRSGACQALQRVGGKSLQEQCEKKYGNKLGDGEVAEIDTAGKLPCKTVFLTVLPPYTEESKEGYKVIIQTFLNLAVAKKFTSVALPALGTGFLNYPKLQACKWMYEAVTEYTQKNPTTCLKNVRFIMYAKDHSTLQTFRNHVMKLQGKKSHTGRTLNQQRDNQPATANWGGDRKPAKFNATHDGCQIREVTLKVTKGDILSEKTDAIVSSVGKHFEFVGAVAQALLQKCPQLKKECGNKTKALKIKLNGLTSTLSCGLNAKHIIHVQFDDTLAGWRKKILKCLEKANHKKWRSLAFPVLGSGAGPKNFNPDDIAKELFEAIHQFTSGNTNVILKDVRLIVYKGQPQMFDPIIKALHKKTQEAITNQSSGTMGQIWKTTKEYFQKTISPEDKQREKTYSSLTLIIHSDSKDNIDRCKREIETKLDNAYQEAWIKKSYDDVVKSLSDEQVNGIEAIPYTVDIKIDKKKGFIKISGPSQQVGQAHGVILDMLRNIDKCRNAKKEAETLYKVVQWHNEEITLTETKLVPYDMMINYTIEKAYKDNKTTVNVGTDNDGIAYVVDFQTYEEYPANDKNNAMKVVRKDMVKAATESLPAEWSQMKDRENIKLVTLKTTDAAYKTVEQRFLSEVKNGKYTHRIQFSLANLTITKIERIQNKALYQQYRAKKKLLEQEKSNLPANMPIEREVWHGTTPDVISSIQTHGFNRGYSGKNGTWFGEGVYFAGDASYSARGWLSGAQGAAATTGIKGYIFLVKTLTGQYCKGHDKMRFLPSVNPAKPTVLYDSAVDDVANPMEFVIFNDTQAYPEYILTFTA